MAGNYLGSPCRSGHSGWRSEYGHCIECRRIGERKRYKENPEAHIKKVLAWRKINRERYATYTASYYAAHSEKAMVENEKWRAANPERIKELYERRKKEQPHKLRANEARRRAAKQMRTPLWADSNAIRMIYRAADVARKTFSEEIHVDHVIPLRGRTVSGLHVHNNLRLLFAKDNLKKLNKFT